MNTILVWFLVTIGGNSATELVYSPPMPDLEMCQHLEKSLQERRGTGYILSRCVQIRMVVNK